ncbi:alpha/beta fold hydrolase [Conexibacter sp. CPCC 206217]|uniref:alpha/beta fold hydrolase n=1 Tax=Conexibacter sp. CPCC 206217 TaxID=3064574 RepID=UPI0027175142|nr:alpha/beta hydrolase [Conexibacter sp. CPCC 206217]MDO8213156.1 alpha/beta hydrolase [Conexibacter sp. CPCC 206217]
MATFVLVPGAWHGGWCWQRLAPLLRAEGHTAVAVTLTGLGERAHLVSPAVTLDTHVRDVVGVLDCERLSDVVLVGHSYAGQVVAGVASARPQLVGRVVYLDAFLPHDGERAIDLQPPQIAHHYRESVAAAGFGWLIPPRSLEVLGVPEQADRDWLADRLVPHPFRTYTDPATVSAQSRAIPSAFVECVDWMRVFRPFGERAREFGWPVHELATGHEAMVTAPAQLAQVLGAIVDRTGAEV